VRPRQALCHGLSDGHPIGHAECLLRCTIELIRSPQETSGTSFSPANRYSMATFPLTHRLKRLRILDSLGSAGSLGFWLVNDEMKAPRFSSIELKVEGMARRKANRQLLRVPS